MIREWVQKYSSYVAGTDTANDGKWGRIQGLPCVKWWSSDIVDGRWGENTYENAAKELIILAQEVLDED